MIADAIQRLGFNFTYKVSTRGLTGIDFCKQYFYECDGTDYGWTTFKDPGSQLFKLGISTVAPAHHHTERTYQLIRSKVYSLCAESFGLKICEVALSLLREADRNPTFDTVREVARLHNPDADQWSLCSVK